MDTSTETSRVGSKASIVEDKSEYKDLLKNLIDTAVKNAFEQEMQKATQELVEEQRKAIRQIVDGYKLALRQIVDEEKKSIWEKAEELRKSLLKLGI